MIKTILKFEASWCASCKALDKQLELFKQLHPEIEVKSIDVEENIPATNFYGVRSLPTMILLGREEGQLVSDSVILNRHTGILPLDQIIEFVKKDGDATV